MPMGDIAIDREPANAICEETAIAKQDSSAHRFEHSLETQLPFLQYFKKEFKIVPICLMKLKVSTCKALSEGIVRAINRLGRPVLLVASSDMTHYESHDAAWTKDRKAIAFMQNRDPVGLWETVRSEKITMCGVNPVTVMLLCSFFSSTWHPSLECTVGSLASSFRIKFSSSSPRFNSSFALSMSIVTISLLNSSFIFSFNSLTYSYNFSFTQQNFQFQEMPSKWERGILVQ